eukprot:jgi/Mesen1/5510/ME000277S04711
MAEAIGGEATDDVSLLVILVDTNPAFWASQRCSSSGKSTSCTGPLELQSFFQQVSVFINSHHLLHHLNQLAVIATGYRHCKFLYHTRAQGPGLKKNGPSQKSQTPTEYIAEQLDEFCRDEGESLGSHVGQAGEEPASLLSASLSMALTYVMKVLKGAPPQPRPRILCLHGSPDASQQYVAVMNAIFSAQRSSVPIDTCMLGGQDSAFLQQAAFLSGGVYLKPPRPEGLLQYLLMVYATDLHSRRFLQLPRPAGVDFRASCFCHKKAIDLGFVCSVCLSIFCKHCKMCSTCGATFASKAQGTQSGVGLKKKA